MKPKTIGLLLLMVFLLPVIAGAVSEKDFEVQTMKIEDLWYSTYLILIWPQKGAKSTNI